MHRIRILLCLGALLAGWSQCVAGADEMVDYQRQIQPILLAKCGRCHGGANRKSGLDLLSPTGLLKGGEGGPVLVPGKPDESSLHARVRDGEMPPGGKDRLSESERELLRRWIAEGGNLPIKAGDPPLTQHDVIPIFLRHCAPCHGRHRQEAGLDLRTPAQALRGGKSGPAVIPWRPEESPVIRRITQGQMPPAAKLVDACVKPVDSSDLAKLRRWIAEGARSVDVQPDVATNLADTLVTDKDREFWSFRSPLRPPVPTVGDGAKIRNPVDAFILQKLAQKGLTLSPEADRLTLLRRATFDLTGLPPTPDEARAFLADRSPRAYENLIDRLLSSPRHGERWGRYWLDVAGYADSEGKREQDLPRPHAWRYRDYVIRSFNSDKPYDRFLLEQLAGDELADHERAGEITGELSDNLVATGFLRMTPDATWANITGFLPDRLEVMADQMQVLGSSVLGLTLQCARCHTHKFDPIPQRDYYRLLAVFRGALDEYDWLKPDIRPGIGPESVDVAPARLLRCVPTAERKAWEAKKEGPEPGIQALWDRGEPSPAYVYRRGDPNQPTTLVGPGVPSVLTDGKTPFPAQPPWPGAKKTGRRLAFARWLTRPDHPLTARVMVNRIWKHHCGTGIVPTLANFGKTGAAPTHPELLDWLAMEFANPSEPGGEPWKIKRIHRLIMTSATYRQSSAVTPGLQSADPTNALHSRARLVRLDAEALYDAMLMVSGRLDETPGGPADAVKARADGLVTPVGSSKGWRRLVYAQQTRKQPASHAELFDFPQMNPNCVERRDSTVATQALHLLNNGMVAQLAGELAKRVEEEAGEDPAKQVMALYMRALSRPPTETERDLTLQAIIDLRSAWERQGGPAQVDRAASRLKALTTVCHAILNSAAFLHID